MSTNYVLWGNTLWGDGLWGPNLWATTGPAPAPPAVAAPPSGGVGSGGGYMPQPSESARRLQAQLEALRRQSEGDTRFNPAFIAAQNRVITTWLLEVAASGVLDQ